ncbi:MAG: hypothetical protein QGH11_07630 [Pirellulaceae bacterium]|nr:hypothetical protein [Pirellulaceae bacterium]
MTRNLYPLVAEQPRDFTIIDCKESTVTTGQIVFFGCIVVLCLLNTILNLDIQRDLKELKAISREKD